ATAATCAPTAATAARTSATCATTATAAEPSAECRVQSAELRACFQFITLHSALITSFVDSFDDDVRAESRDDEAVAHVEAAGERGLVLRLGLPGLVIPELAVGAVAVPAEVAVGDR